jgi:hypothetical protein
MVASIVLVECLLIELYRFALESFKTDRKKSEKSKVAEKLKT